MKNLLIIAIAALLVSSNRGNDEQVVTAQSKYTTDAELVTDLPYKPTIAVDKSLNDRVVRSLRKEEALKQVDGNYMIAVGKYFN